MEECMKKHRADWMAAGSYGVMVHYLVTPRGESRAEKTADFNRIVDAFDLDGFLEQFAAAGADWLIFTIGQNTNYYCSPNPWLDERRPGHTSNRDLILELGTRLRALDKRLILYLPAEAFGLCPELREAFRFTSADPGEHLRCYQQFVAEYSRKMRGLYDGWWFDGCYDHVREQFAWDWNGWLAAARAGNPDAITAFNDAAFCVGRIKPITPLEEYHAGEVHMLENGKIRTDFIDPEGDIVQTADGKIRIKGQEPTLYMPDSRFVDGVQWQALVPVDSTFNPGIPDMHYDDDELFSFVKACKEVGGAVTLNAPLDIETGLINERTAAQLARLGKALQG
jgi:hypothetical protein